MTLKRVILTTFMIFFATILNPVLAIHKPTSETSTRDPKRYSVYRETQLAKNETPPSQEVQYQVIFNSERSNLFRHNFPHDFMTQYQRQNGGVVVHVLFAAYIFTALALVCDRYFIPSLELISGKLHLSSDVAGATLMAAGGSAPELFTSIIGVFITKNEIAFGAVAGSGLFNSLFVVAICGLFAGTDLRLKPWPLLRDCFYYFLSIAVLIVVIYDEKVYWYEALVLVTMYLVYVVVMYFNTTLENYYEILTGNNMSITSDVKESIGEKTSLLMTNSENTTKVLINYQNDQSIDHFYHSPFSVPQEIMWKIWWVFTLPITCLFYMTIPDCRKIRWEKWYAVSFFISMTWIGLLTYVLVWMVSIIGFTLGIPNVIMGMTFLAAGSSGPDGASSLLVARQGNGDMAVSNSIGSNVFDILLCLGLPWLVKSSLQVSKGFVAVQNGGMIYVLIILITTMLVVPLLTKINRWNLNKCLGVTLLICYLIFVAVSGVLTYLFSCDRV